MENFDLEFDVNYGLMNNAQKGGSCIFYSYYNLGLNMIIIKILENNELEEIKKIDIMVEYFLIFHFKMLYLFGICNDTKYLEECSYKDLKSKKYHLTYISQSKQ